MQIASRAAQLRKASICSKPSRAFLSYRAERTASDARSEFCSEFGKWFFRSTKSIRKRHFPSMLARGRPENRIAIRSPPRETFAKMLVAAFVADSAGRP